MTETRNVKDNPLPILNMGVEILPEWNEQFWKLSRMLKLSHKETINWVVNNWFQYHSDHDRHIFATGLTVTNDSALG